MARCGKCGRKLHVYYQGKNSMPGYYRGNSHVLNGRGVWCMRIGGVRIDDAVAERFLEAIDPVGMEAALEAQRLQESEHQNALKQFRLQVERVQYEAERSYQNVEPENRQFVEKAPDGYVRMPEAMRRLGVSRQTIMQRAKRGEIPAVHVHRGKRKGLYINVIDNNEQLFDETLSPNV